MITVILAAMLYPVAFMLAARRWGGVELRSFMRGWRLAEVVALAAMDVLAAVSAAPIAAAMAWPANHPMLLPVIAPSLANVCRGAFGIWLIVIVGGEFLRLCERKSKAAGTTP